jgi:hypothetical protein
MNALERSDGCTELTCPQHGERNSWHQEVVRLRGQLQLALEREGSALGRAADHAEREGVEEAKAREFARQAREGGRLRVAVRHLVDTASAGFIHDTSEWDAVVKASDLLDALNGEATP